MSEQASDRDLVRALGPVGAAFFGNFRTLRDVQRAAIPRILAGRDVLVASATASGKTEAVLAPLVARTLNHLPVQGRSIRMLLIAPTRALVKAVACGECRWMTRGASTYEQSASVASPRRRRAVARRVRSMQSTWPPRRQHSLDI